MADGTRNVLRSSAEEFRPRNLNRLPCYDNIPPLPPLLHQYYVQSRFASPPPPPPPVPGLVDGCVVWAHFTVPVSAGTFHEPMPSKGAREENDSHFQIREDGSTSDQRTTVMIRNIPNNYSKEKLLNMIDAHCIESNKDVTSDQPPSSYDLFHLPTNFRRPGNVGYVFVNMTSPQAVRRLYNAFHNQKWEGLNSLKISQVSYAKLQGLDAYKEKFKDSRLPCMPVVFNPPRDGQRHTQEMSITEWQPRRTIKFGSFPEVSY